MAHEGRLPAHRLARGSARELRHRNAESLFQMIEERHGKVVGLSVATVQDWIDQAKAWKE